MKSLFYIVLFMLALSPLMIVSVILTVWDWDSKWVNYWRKTFELYLDDLAHK